MRIQGKGSVVQQLSHDTWNSMNNKPAVRKYWGGGWIQTSLSCDDHRLGVRGESTEQAPFCLLTGCPLPLPEIADNATKPVIVFSLW